MQKSLWIKSGGTGHIQLKLAGRLGEKGKPYGQQMQAAL